MTTKLNLNKALKNELRSGKSFDQALEVVASANKHQRLLVTDLCAELLYKDAIGKLVL